MPRLRLSAQSFCVGTRGRASSGIGIAPPGRGERCSRALTVRSFSEARYSAVIAIPKVRKSDPFDAASHRPGDKARSERSADADDQPTRSDNGCDCECPAENQVPSVTGNLYRRRLQRNPAWATAQRILRPELRSLVRPLSSHQRMRYGDDAIRLVSASALESASSQRAERSPRNTPTRAIRKATDTIFRSRIATGHSKGNARPIAMISFQSPRRQREQLPKKRHLADQSQPRKHGHAYIDKQAATYFCVRLRSVALARSASLAAIRCLGTFDHPSE